MKLDLDFPALELLVRQIGASPVVWVSGERKDEVNIREILENGLYVIESLNDITTDGSGAFVFQGERVLVYIKDSNKTEYDLRHNPESAPRFHFSYCRTIDRMRRERRYDRYVATRKRDGQFRVDVFTDDSRRAMKEIEIQLMVCRNCLSSINYRSYRQRDDAGRKQIFQSFNISEFLNEAEVTLTIVPTYSDDTYPGSNYPENWDEISRATKFLNGYQCTQCLVRLQQQPHLLQVHHENGVKGNTSPDNLKVLCLICHSEQPSHGWMHVRSEHRQEIIHMRREQGIFA